MPITAYYPESEKLATLDYRSKLDLTENVRLVEIAGTDLCACCAPHCRSTGQIGLIKIINAESYKGGTKLWIVCGGRALAYFDMLLSQAKNISHLLCAKIEKIAPATERLHAAKQQAEYDLVALKRGMIAEKIAAVPPTQGVFLEKCSFKGDDLRLYAEGLKEKVSGIITVLEGDDASGYRYVITAGESDIMPLVKAANTALVGRGGGRDNMARGTFAADFESIKAFFENNGR